MNKIRFFLFSTVVILTGLIAFGLASRPQVKNADALEFSAERIIEDIRGISQHHHSVAHPEERADVREYLISRLQQIGADTVRTFEYKSLTGPENKHVTYTFDATNILATFNPKQAQDEQTYLLMVAHYDSRYSQPMAKGDTVWSYGAADDGYGIGVILETVNQALKYRDEWEQGIKILFTDAEEVGMKGMKAMWERNHEEFNDVGFMINLEARGPYGPALLFETSPGNEKIMELYKYAEYPFTYSLTTVVYGFMPNFTDFTIVKDEIPGMNFSTIADINHYHTDLDNFSNINARSIQHYGSQVTPVVHKYLTEKEYSDINSLKSNADTINFTIPYFGLFNFSKETYTLLNIAIYIIFIIIVTIDILRGRVQLRKILRRSGITILSAIGTLAIGELIAFVCCIITGVKFNPFGIVQGVSFDNFAMGATVVVATGLVAAVHIRLRSRSISCVENSLRTNAKSLAALTNATNSLYGTLLPMLLFSALLLISINENLMFFIPLSISTIAMVLYRISKQKIFTLLAIGLILLHAFSFLHALAMALTIGAFGAVLMLALLDLLAIIPLADIYLTKKN